ncbi:MAG: FecR domain-containing protein [Sphingobium sp.]
MSDSLREAHRQASDWLILLREEPESAAVRERFEAWLDADPDHARAWVSVSEVFDTIGATRPELETQWRGALAGIGEASERPSTRRRWFHLPAARLRRPILAGAVAAALALWFAPSAILHIQSDHVTRTGETRALRLADGSAVRLGPDSAIAIDYSQGERTVRLLAGQAWFDVKRNPAAPFRVVAGDVRTTVLGTSFDVRRFAASTDVSVREGRVRVVDYGVKPATSRDLSPGEWIRVNADHDVESGADNPDLLGAWQDGSLVVRNRPIAEVIEELRPWYKGRIVLLASDLGRKRVDGVYDARDPARALIALVGRAGGKVHTITPWLIVIS